MKQDSPRREVSRQGTSRVLRWLGITAGALFALLVVAAGTVYALSNRRLHRKYPVAVAVLRAIPTDSASIARGAHLATIATCVLCHGEDLGGAVYSSSAAVGVVAGPNLTKGKGGRTLSDADLVRAIRHGVRADSTSLIVMPSEVFTHLSEPDLAALMAYIRHAPPVDREVPASGFGPMGRVLLAAGKLNILVAGKTPNRPLRPGVPVGLTVEYGRYLADAVGCHGCHGYGLSGGTVAGPPGLPPASNLTPAGDIAEWTEQDFARAMREGRRPSGAPLNDFMPWAVYRHMTDDEIRALWLYLKSVPAKAFGNK